MAVYTYKVANEFNFPNITIYNRLVNGVKRGWKATANNGYVFYNPNDIYYEHESPNIEPRKVTYYYKIHNFPYNYDMSKFSLIAIPIEEVDVKYIF